jgi:hypothetical protein
MITGQRAENKSSKFSFFLYFQGLGVSFLSCLCMTLTLHLVLGLPTPLCPISFNSAF